MIDENIHITPFQSSVSEVFMILYYENMAKLKSIKKLLLNNILMLLFLLSMVLGMGKYLDYRRDTQIGALYANDMVIKDLTAKITQYETSYKTFLGDGNAFSLEAFVSCSKDITDAMEEADPLFSASPEMLLYARTVCQIVESLRIWVVDKLNGKFDRPESFEVMQFISFGFTQLFSHWNNLIGAYIIYSGESWNMLNNQQRMYNRSQSLFQFIATCLILIPMLFINKDFIKRLQEINKASEELAMNNWDSPDLHPSKYEEFSNVSNAFNNMKKTIRQNIDAMERSLVVQQELAEQKRLIQETRFNMLQAQINPHFLFNTLNMIIRSIQMDKKEKAARLVMATSNLLRQSIDLQEGAIPLDDELALLDNYITIQKERTDGRIRFVLEVFDHPQILIPPFTLQPLVENAIKHGLGNRTEGGIITIQVFSDESEGSFIVVSDNGEGIPPATLNGILTHQADPNKASHGLSNVIERLRMLHPGKDVIHIASDAKGTMIRIHIDGEDNHAVQTTHC